LSRQHRNPPNEMASDITHAFAGTLPVQAFIATNGWNMHTGNVVLTYGLEKTKRIRGLPWECIREREFPALTHDGILYVVLTGWHHDCNGIAYNPRDCVSVQWRMFVARGR